VIAVERVAVGGERVRIRRRLGGDVRGSYEMESWLRRSDGLLLRRTFESETRVDAIVGSVPAREEYDLRLRSLQPRGE
jgi:hypothetical protein